MYNPIIPMFVVSGKPKRNEIIENLDNLKSVGIDQIMLYPRKGCELEYMSDEWVELISNILIDLKNRNMRVWLNDDFHFPSGNANGVVTSIDDYCLKSITVKGEKKGTINIPNKDNQNSQRYADVLNKDAVDLFIKESHNKYYELFGTYFGNVIAGFYTDEPSFWYVVKNDNLPYYYGIEDDYQKKFNRSFIDDLNNEYANFESNVMQISSLKFKESYVDNISNWCRNHKVIMTGHLMEDDRPYIAAKSNGNILNVLSGFMLPGVDDIWTDFSRPYLLTLLGNADAVKTDLGAMAELFALGPVDNSYSKLRAMMYLCSCFGINHYFYAIYHVNVKGNRPINNYFNHFGKARPDFEGLRLMSREALIAHDIAQISFSPDVRVKYPYTEYTKDIVENANSDGLCDNKFVELINMLSKYQIQWRYIEENAICDNVPTLEIKRDGSIFIDSKPSTNDEVIARFSNPVLYNLDNSIPEGIFIRKLANGKSVVVNLKDEEGYYLFNEKKIYIPNYGVLILEDISDAKEIISDVSDVKFNLKYKNNNIARMMYLNDTNKAILKLENDFNLKFAIREECEFLLDGKQYETKKCNMLSSEFDLLYKMTDVIHLQGGEYIIESGNDYKYLPSVVLCGNFKVDYESGDICKAILSKREDHVCINEKIYDHGVVSFETELLVPKDAKILRVKCNNSYFKVLVNDSLVLESAFGPNEIDVTKYNGQNIKLTIEIYSSLGSYFGDVNYFNYHQSAIRWRSTKPSHVSSFCVEKIEFLK